MLHSFGAHPCQDQWEREGEGVGDVGEEEGEEEVEKGCKPVDDLPSMMRRMRKHPIYSRISSFFYNRSLRSP
jgi:hypothetical protein